ncbi:autism susceptibility protein 2 [Platysternon megacephalum]|uniref:Autism susceptibility protein 2 n=1 Tax=Platysternon megacephalum TaxID=55544 RepID=A0A4D9ENN5_9SAUR|nr:autism susceptibility protein 2 [Platysternon megacephalum]
MHGCQQPLANGSPPFLGGLLSVNSSAFDKHWVATPKRCYQAEAGLFLFHTPVAAEQPISSNQMLQAAFPSLSAEFSPSPPPSRPPQHLVVATSPPTIACAQPPSQGQLHHVLFSLPFPPHQ